MNANQRRERVRRLLAGADCVAPASVHDVLSARIAESVGFELALLSGSIASSAILAGPDLILHTLSELADHVRRITRGTELSLIIDADNGFGNALAVMRAVEELEHAGAAILSVEDTTGPVFAGGGAAHDLVSLDEAVGKYRAAVAARSDPSLVIAARTRSLDVEGRDGWIRRAKAYAAAGVDVIWTPQIGGLADVAALHEAVGLPLVVGSKHAGLKRQDLAKSGVRIALRGHQPIAAAVKAMQETYLYLLDDGQSGRQMPSLASSAEMDQILDAEAFEKRRQAYMQAPARER